MVETSKTMRELNMALESNRVRREGLKVRTQIRIAEEKLEFDILDREETTLRHIKETLEKEESK